MELVQIVCVALTVVAARSANKLIFPRCTRTVMIRGLAGSSPCFASIPLRFRHGAPHSS
jgi:hypothetical protein